MCLLSCSYKYATFQQDNNVLTPMKGKSSPSKNMLIQLRVQPRVFPADLNDRVNISDAPAEGQKHRGDIHTAV